ncbi:MAG: hypothetical protein LKE40_00820 [Spirochaetia bacterium]|nr:hypothetical protein [Spirochaetia bacterium]
MSQYTLNLLGFRLNDGDRRQWTAKRRTYFRTSGQGLSLMLPPALFLMQTHLSAIPKGLPAINGKFETGSAADLHKLTPLLQVLKADEPDRQPNVASSPNDNDCLKALLPQLESAVPFLFPAAAATDFRPVLTDFRLECYSVRFLDAGGVIWHLLDQRHLSKDKALQEDNEHNPACGHGR